MAAYGNVNGFSDIDVFCFIEHRQVNAACGTALFYDLGFSDRAVFGSLLIHYDKLGIYFPVVILERSRCIHAAVHTVIGRT